MKTTDNVPLIIALSLLVAVVYVFFSDSSPVKNEGELPIEEDREEDLEEDLEEEYDALQEDDTILETPETTDEEEPSDSKDISLANSKQDMGKIDKFFESRGPADNGSDDYDLQGVSERDFKSISNRIDTFAKYKGDENKSLLPGKSDKDWFDQVHPIEVKNANLIDVHRPIAMSTSSGSTRNSSYDIRGTPIIKKRLDLGPWDMSSIEPNNYATGLCGRPKIVSGMGKK